MNHIGEVANRHLESYKNYNNKTASIGNFSHEFGHNLGLDQPNGGSSDGGLMNYPPGGLSSTDVDTIIKEVYEKK